MICLSVEYKYLTTIAIFKTSQMLKPKTDILSDDINT